jgi:hypothetical protein
MIANYVELKVTLERIAYFQDLVSQVRVAAKPELLPAMASGYRAEVEKMQREVINFLTRHVSKIPAHVE